MVVWEAGAADPTTGTLTLTLRGLTTEETTVRTSARVHRVEVVMVEVVVCGGRRDGGGGGGDVCECVCE